MSPFRQTNSVNSFRNPRTHKQLAFKDLHMVSSLKGAMSQRFGCTLVQTARIFDQEPPLLHENYS